MPRAEEPMAAASVRNFNLAAAFRTRRMYKKAIPDWKKVLATTDDKQRLQTARMHLVICDFHDRQYAETVKLAEALLKEHPAADENDVKRLRRNCLIHLAASESRLEHKEKADATLARLEAEFPKLVDLAVGLAEGKQPQPIGAAAKPAHEEK